MENTRNWILLDTTPSQYTHVGLPKIGDPISLEYDKKGTPWTGVAKTTGSSTDTAKDSYVAQEFKGSFMFSAGFGI